jgi:3-oxoadipate enol-lactonase
VTLNRGQSLVVTPTHAARVRYYDIDSADGTRIRAWTNDGEGPTVFLSNGLGTNPHAWPSLLRPDCGLRVVGWNHRGVSGSEQPKNRRVDLDAYVEDALAVMDDAGIESAVVPAWSAGVTIAFELANRHPERVKGILAVAGVPGNTFGTMLAPLHVPGPVAKRMMIGLTLTGIVGGRAIGLVSRNIPWTNAVANMLRRTRMINPNADTEELRALFQEFCTTDPRWYAHLAMDVSKHSRVSLSRVQVPVTFMAGDWDVLTGAKHMRTAAERIPGSRFVELHGTHFLPVEYPDVVLEELKALVERAG